MVIECGGDEDKSSIMAEPIFWPGYAYKKKRILVLNLQIWTFVLDKLKLIFLRKKNLLTERVITYGKKIWLP